MDERGEGAFCFIFLRGGINRRAPYRSCGTCARRAAASHARAPPAVKRGRRRRRRRHRRRRPRPGTPACCARARRVRVVYLLSFPAASRDRTLLIDIGCQGSNLEPRGTGAGENNMEFFQEETLRHKTLRARIRRRRPQRSPPLGRISSAPAAALPHAPQPTGTLVVAPPPPPRPPTCAPYHNSRAKGNSVMKLDVVRPDTRCAVCWGTLKKVKVVSPCLHRFCTACIEEHLRKLCVPRPLCVPPPPQFYFCPR